MTQQNTLTDSTETRIDRFKRKLFAQFATSRQQQMQAADDAAAEARAKKVAADNAWLDQERLRVDARNRHTMCVAELQTVDYELQNQATVLGKELVNLARELAEQTATLEIATLTETGSRELEQSVLARSEQLRGYVKLAKSRLVDLKQRQSGIQAKIRALK